MNNIQLFLGLLGAANAVTVDDGPLLADWGIAEVTGDPVNQVVNFAWTDGEHDYLCSMDEGGIAEGAFDSEGKFVGEDSEGEKVVVKFFKVERLTKVS